MSPTEVQELDERLSRIRMPVNELARRVSCDPMTIAGQIKGKRRANQRLLRDVVSEVAREERELLAHLVRLHPDEARQALAAA